MYIEDTIHDPKAEWYIKGVDLDQNYTIINFLSPGVIYRAYMVEATQIGNGPPSEKFYFVTKPARKNHSFISLNEYIWKFCSFFVESSTGAHLGEGSKGPGPLPFFDTV